MLATDRSVIFAVSIRVRGYANMSGLTERKIQ